MASMRKRPRRGRIYFVIRTASGREYGAGFDEGAANRLLKRYCELELLARHGLDDEKPPTGKVYFLLNEAAGAVKIGFTARSPESRAKCLSTGSPDPLRVLAAVPGTRTLERLLHEKFESVRISGEWFRLTPAIMTFVEGASK